MENKLKSKTLQGIFKNFHLLKTYAYLHEVKCWNVTLVWQSFRQAFSIMAMLVRVVLEQQLLICDIVSFMTLTVI